MRPPLAALRDINGDATQAYRRHVARARLRLRRRQAGARQYPHPDRQAEPDHDRLGMGNCFTAGRSRPEQPASRTPDGSYTPFRMEVMHYSQEWDNAGVPHAIFFTTRGHSIHGSDHPGLGTPVSHGCVRLTLTNATTLYDLVTAEGMGKTTVIVRGDDPPVTIRRANRRSRSAPLLPSGACFASDEPLG